MIRAEEGNVTVLALGLTGLVLALVLALGDLGIFLLARSRAQAGADAAALAAAAELVPGTDSDPRGEAARFAAANKTRLVAFEADSRSGSVEVGVKVAVRFNILRSVKDVSARARAEVNLARFRRGPAGVH